MRMHTHAVFPTCGVNFACPASIVGGNDRDQRCHSDCAGFDHATRAMITSFMISATASAIHRVVHGHALPTRQDAHDRKHRVFMPCECRCQIHCFLGSGLCTSVVTAAATCMGCMFLAPLMFTALRCGRPLADASGPSILAQPRCRCCNGLIVLAITVCVLRVHVVSNTRHLVG